MSFIYRQNLFYGTTVTSHNQRHCASTRYVPHLSNICLKLLKIWLLTKNFKFLLLFEQCEKGFSGLFEGFKFLNCALHETPLYYIIFDESLERVSSLRDFQSSIGFQNFIPLLLYHIISLFITRISEFDALN